MLKQMQKSLHGNKKGFSLIELIVVIAIIGILVMLAAPKLMGFTEKAQLARIQSDVKVMEGKIAEQYIDSGYDFDGDIDGSVIDDMIGEKTVYSIEGKVDKGTIANVKHKIVETPIVKDSRTKLDGTFYADAEGNVYYVEDKANTVDGGSEPEGGENTNNNQVYATDIDADLNISKISISNNGTSEYIFFERMGLASMGYFGIPNEFSLESLTVSKATKLFEAGESIGNAVEHPNPFVTTNNYQLVDDGHLMHDNGSIYYEDYGDYLLAGNPYNGSEIKKIKTIYGGSTAVLYEDGKMFVYKDNDNNFIEVLTSASTSKIIDFADTYAINEDGEVFYFSAAYKDEDFEMSTMSASGESFEGLNIVDIYETSVQEYWKFLDSDGNEYDNGGNLDNPSNEIKGIADTNGRDYRFDESANKIEKFNTITSTFEEIDYGDLNPNDVVKIATGTDYVLILDKDGNVWVHGYYNAPIA